MGGAFLPDGWLETDKILQECTCHASESLPPCRKGLEGQGNVLFLGSMYFTVQLTVPSAIRYSIPHLQLSH